MVSDEKLIVFDPKMPEIIAKFDQILIKIDHPEQKRGIPL